MVTFSCIFPTAYGDIRTSRTFSTIESALQYVKSIGMKYLIVGSDSRIYASNVE